MKSEKEAREKAILMNLESQMNKKIKKQRIGGDQSSDDRPDSDREESSSLIKALKEQQKELADLIKNTRTKQEEKLLNEN